MERLTTNTTRSPYHIGIEADGTLNMSDGTMQKPRNHFGQVALGPLPEGYNSGEQSSAENSDLGT